MGLKTDLAAARTKHEEEKQAMQQAADGERCGGEQRAAALHCRRLLESSLGSIPVYVCVLGCSTTMINLCTVVCSVMGTCLRMLWSTGFAVHVLVEIWGLVTNIQQW